VAGAAIGMRLGIEYFLGGQFVEDLITPKRTPKPRRSLMNILRGRR
jgi:hypothetical protein